MSTTFYQWGKLTGGIDPHSGGAAVPAEAPYGPAEQFTGTLLAATTVTFTTPTKFVTIRNTDDWNALEYSFDNATWFACVAHQVIQESVNTAALYLRAVAGTPTYEVLGILTA